MTLWNGYEWVQDPPTPPSRPQRGVRFLGAAAEAGIIVTLIFGLIAGTALAAPGNGKGRGSATHTSPGSCEVADQVVSATGLPTDEVIKFMVTDGNGTVAWVLGMTPDGTRTVTVPTRIGPTTYEFVSRTYGNNGSKYRTFAACAG